MSGPLHGSKQFEKWGAKDFRQNHFVVEEKTTIDFVELFPQIAPVDAQSFSLVV